MVLLSPKIKETHSELEMASLQDIYEDVNRLQPSLIRLDADELTYTLHIIIRYELEKDLINGRIKVCDLPALWNEKYEKYLGIKPTNDREGVLQDIHWAAGYIGYFPLYFVSNIAATQLTASIEREYGSFDVLWLAAILTRLTTGLPNTSFSTEQSILLISSWRPLQRSLLIPQYYIDYLRKKYSEVYKLNLKEKANE